MPRHLIPHKSGVHRIAAIALYRALLTQCKALPIPGPQATDIQNIIRNRFKEQRHVTSHRLLGVSFTAGYQAIDHLDNAVAGDEQSKAYLLDLLARAPTSAKQPPPHHTTKAEREAQRKQQRQLERAERAKTPTINLWDRPLPREKLSGKRHVPVLVNANHIPMLRLKKPQPESLSMYINARILQRQRRHDQRQMFEQGLDLAREEDRWDHIVQRTCGVERRASGNNDGRREPAWRDEVSQALQVVHRLLEEEKEKNGRMAARMQDIVDKETELFRKEQAEDRAAKKIAKAQKRVEKEAAKKEV